jgi:formylmethanofuran dehydrogenase subunit A
MFATPRYVIKGGMLVVEEGQLRRAPAGRRLHVRPGYDHSMLTDLSSFFEEYSTIALENYPVHGIPDDPLPLPS